MGQGVVYLSIFSETHFHSDSRITTRTDDIKSFSRNEWRNFWCIYFPGPSSQHNVFDWNEKGYEKEKNKFKNIPDKRVSTVKFQMLQCQECTHTNPLKPNWMVGYIILKPQLHVTLKETVSSSGLTAASAGRGQSTRRGPLAPIHRPENPPSLVKKLAE